MENTTGKKFLQFITDLVWYMDSHWGTLKNQGIQKPCLVHEIYLRNKTENGNEQPFNDYLKKQQTRPKLTCEELKSFINEGGEFLQTVWMKLCG